MGRLSSKARELCALGVFTASLLGLPQKVAANPTGGQVVSGGATIHSSPGTVLVNQSTSSAIINWQSFSIQSGELTRFIVPSASSLTLNRVLGGNVSEIYGTLKSNGQLYLVNPNGIVVGSSGQIDTAGFVGSTLDVSDAEFSKQGNLTFSGSGGTIDNEGTINATSGGVYLIATQVNNGGTLTAPNGTVGLAAGTQVFLQKEGDTHLFVQAGDTSNPRATGVTNGGKIAAAAAELRAAGGNAYALAINNTGNIAASGIANVNGQVYLTSDGGDISNSGVITARKANGRGGKVVLNGHSSTGATQGTVLNSGMIAATGSVGGTVELLGDRVGVTDKGVVDVSGDNGGGTALIGGDLPGVDSGVPDASQSYVGPDATIKADALTLGGGGTVVVWGDESAQVYGNVSAKGGANGGNGGLVETSAPDLDVQTTPDVSAPKGKGGTWLMDPTDIDIVDTGATTGGFTAPFTVTAGPYTLNQADLLAALRNGDVTLDASGGSGGSGNITWTQTGGLPFDISTINGSTLTLNAPGTLQLTGITIHSSNGSGRLNLTLNNNDPEAGSVNISNSTIDLKTGALYASGEGGITIDPATISAGSIELSSSSISITGSKLTTTLPATGNFGGASIMLVDDVSEGATGLITISTSTLTAPSMQIGYPAGYYSSGFGSPSQVSINASALTLTGGTPNSGLRLDIEGLSGTAGDAGVSITNGSAIASENSANVYIDGTGLLDLENDAVGVLVSSSSITMGTAGSPGNDNLDIAGYSDAGFTDLGTNEGFANNSYGVEMLSSTITSYSKSDYHIHGTSYAADNVNAYGIYIDGGTYTVTNSGEHFHGSALPENYGEGSGEANFVNGVYTVDGATFKTTGATGAINFNGDTLNTTATDNGDTTVHVRNTGVNLTDGTTISTTGGPKIGDGGVLIGGEAGPAVASSGNASETSSLGIWIHADNGTTGDGGSITIGGLGGLGMVGRGGDATGPDAVSYGIVTSDSSGVSVSITAPGGGALGLAGLGGMITASTGSGTFNGSNGGLLISDTAISTPTGIIALLGLAGSQNGLPEGSTATSTGVDLNDSTISTDVTSAGAKSFDGVTIEPTIILYGNNGSVDQGTQQFVPNSGGFAVDQNGGSLVTENLVMGNLYSLFSKYATAKILAELTSTVDTDVDNILSKHGVAIDPTGTIELTSPTNEVTNLDAAWVGSSGLNFVDSVNLTVGTIGSSDNTNYGQIDGPAMGPVFIQTSGNLTLTNVNPETGVASTLPVIATSGEGNDITLVTGGAFTNLDNTGVVALDPTNGAVFLVYSPDPSKDHAGNLASSMYTSVYNTPYTGTPPDQSGDLFVYAAATGTMTGGGGGTGTTTTGTLVVSTGNPNNPTLPIDNTLYTVRPISFVSPGAVTQDTQVIGGAGGVATDTDLGGNHGTKNKWSAVTKGDIKDGSTVNTGTLGEKWVANTGLSTIVRVGDTAYLFGGRLFPGGTPPTSFDLFNGESSQQVLGELSHAAFGSGAGARP